MLPSAFIGNKFCNTVRESLRIDAWIEMPSGDFADGRMRDKARQFFGYVKCDHGVVPRKDEQNWLRYCFQLCRPVEIEQHANT